MSAVSRGPAASLTLSNLALNLRFAVRTHAGTRTRPAALAHDNRRLLALTTLAGRGLVAGRSQCRARWHTKRKHHCQTEPSHSVTSNRTWFGAIRCHILQSDPSSSSIVARGAGSRMHWGNGALQTMPSPVAACPQLQFPQRLFVMTEPPDSRIPSTPVRRLD